MDIKPIRTERDYQAALKAISALMASDPEPGTEPGDRLDVLATLVQAYERENFPLDLPDPVEAIKFRMEQQGLSPKDLQPMIGRLNRVYEILNRKRALTMGMAWKLHVGLGIPAECLLRQPVTAPPSAKTVKVASRKPAPARRQHGSLAI